MKAHSSNTARLVAEHSSTSGALLTEGRPRILSDAIYFNSIWGLALVKDVVRVSADGLEATFCEPSVGYMQDPIESGERCIFKQECFVRKVLNPRDRFDRVVYISDDDFPPE